VTRSATDPSIRLHASYAYLGFGSRSGQTQYSTIGGNVVVGGTYVYTGFTYVSTPPTRITIDPNVRVRGNDTYAGFEDVNGPVAVGETVEVHEVESDLTGRGRITEIDAERQLVYLSVDWSSLTEESPQQAPSGTSTGIMLISAAESVTEDDWVHYVAAPCLACVGFSNTTLWVNAPVGSWWADTISPGYRPPYLEVTSRLEILQPYAALRDDRVVA
jgi:hypothetical protein